VTLRVYNVRGQLVKTLVDDTREAGITHRIEWDGRNDAGQRVASGVYFYRLTTRGFAQTRKMVLLK
jgi:flagellar hook assembly protein FlgD